MRSTAVSGRRAGRAWRRHWPGGASPARPRATSRSNRWRRTRLPRVRLEALSNWLRGDTGLPGSSVVSERDLLVGTAFSMSGMARDGGSVALWGRGAIASFDGRENRLSVDGEVANVMLGADWSGGALTAGLMLSHARGSGSYRGESDGKVESTLTRDLSLRAL